MIAELGHFALILAFALALPQAVFGLAGAHWRRPHWMSLTTRAVAGQFDLTPVAMLAPYPNPARGAVACAFEATEGDPVTIGVYDASGRRVRGAKLAPTAGGRGLWMWDGNDDAGNRVRPGVYRVRATGRFGGTSRPVTIL